MSALEFSTPENLFPGVDGWEPYIAVDSNDNLIAFTTAIYYAPNNYTDTIIYRVSMDHGASWFDEQSVFADGVTFQADPVVFIDENGILHFTMMLGWNIFYTQAPSMSSSTNGKLMWSNPVGISGNDDHADKNWIVGDPTGMSLFVTFNKASPYATVSNDGGMTWSDPVMLVDDNSRYYYSSGAVYLSGGSILQSIDGVYEYNVTGEMTGPEEPSIANDPFLQVIFRVFKTNLNNQTWSNVISDTSTQVYQNCPAWANCTNPTDFLIPSSSMASSFNTIYLAHTGNYDNVTHASIFLIKSVDNGSSWSDAIPLNWPHSTNNTYSAFPFIACDADNEDLVHVAWMDNRTGMWNLFYRYSSNGGESWTDEVKLNQDLGYSFQNDQGFEFPYGDYGRACVDSQHNLHLIYGEGTAWYGTGASFYVRQGAIDDSSSSSSDGLSKRDIGAIAGSLGALVLVSAAFGLWWVKRGKNAPSSKEALLETNQVA